MRVTHVRATRADDPLRYRVAIALHTTFSLDAELASVDLMELSRSEVREMMAGIESRTGLVSGLMAIDSTPEEDD